MKKYPPEVEKFVRDNIKGVRIRELAEITNKAMNTSFTYKAMASFCKNRGLTNGLQGGLRKGEAPTKFPPEVEDYMRQIAAGKSSSEIAEMIRERFKIEFSVSQCRTYKKQHNIQSGYDARFKKGHESQNKGKKQSEYMSAEAIEKTKKTRFQKGNKPHNTLQVGDIVKTTDGYLKKKIAEPNKWEFLHKLVWRENFGEIPPEMMISFKDSNRLNCSPDNLFLETRAEHAILNNNNMRSNIPEITECQHTIAKIKISKEQRKRRIKP